MAFQLEAESPIFTAIDCIDELRVLRVSKQAD